MLQQRDTSPSDQKSIDDSRTSYDENGNRTGGGYVVDPNNQIASDGTYNYDYDDEGNLIKKTEIATGEYVEYEYDYPFGSVVPSGWSLAYLSLQKPLVL